MEARTRAYIWSFDHGTKGSKGNQKENTPIRGVRDKPKLSSVLEFFERWGPLKISKACLESL